MTVQDYLDLAYGKSKKNQPTKIVAESTEGLALVNRVIRMFVQLGVRINPAFYMGFDDVAHSEEESLLGPGWPRPVQAEAILLITLADGTEISVVPWDDRGAEAGKPAVYRMGQVFMPAGNDLDPTSTDTLTFYFARRPVDATALTGEIDPIWPEAFAELAAYEIATTFAVKDGRGDEVPQLASERDNWLRMYVAFLQHETMNEVRRWDTRFNLPSAAPILTQLAGGTNVSLANGGA